MKGTLMKKLFILISLLVLASTSVRADENTTGSAQQGFTDNKAVVSIQKQPAVDKQKQNVKNNWFCIVVQVNGKIKDTDSTVPDTRE